MGRSSSIPRVWWAVSAGVALVAAVAVWGVAAAGSDGDEAPPEYSPEPPTEETGEGPGPSVPPDLDVEDNLCWSLEVAELLATAELADEHRDRIATDVAERLDAVSREAGGSESDALEALSQYFAGEFISLPEASLSTVPLGTLLEAANSGRIPDTVVPGRVDVSDVVADHVDDC